MLSNDKNIERIAEFVEESKSWLSLRAEYAKIETLDKLAKVLTALILGFVLFLLLILILIYASFALAYVLGDILHSIPLRFLCVSGGYVLLLLIVLVNRHSWIALPCMRFIGTILEVNGKTKEDCHADIEASEKRMGTLWKEVFHGDEDKKEESPTQRVMNMIYSSAGVIDGVLLGWKLYRKFGGTFKFFRKKK